MPDKTMQQPQKFESPKWMDEFKGIVTVCDLQGTIIYLNDRSIENFRKDGGQDLIGKNLFDCHPEPAGRKLKELMEKGESNIYYTLRNGRRRLINQMPLYENGEYCWYCELILEIPEDTPTFVRG